jgi:hypothetical protein
MRVGERIDEPCDRDVAGPEGALKDLPAFDGVTGVMRMARPATGRSVRRGCRSRLLYPEDA